MLRLWRARRSHLWGCTCRYGKERTYSNILEYGWRLVNTTTFWSQRSGRYNLHMFNATTTWKEVMSAPEVSSTSDDSSHGKVKYGQTKAQIDRRKKFSFANHKSCCGKLNVILKCLWLNSMYTNCFLFLYLSRISKCLQTTRDALIVSSMFWLPHPYTNSLKYTHTLVTTHCTLLAESKYFLYWKGNFPMHYVGCSVGRLVGLS